MPLSSLHLSREPARKVAMGEASADFVIINGRVVYVTTAEISDPTMIAIAGGRIAWVGDCSHLMGPDTRVLDAQNTFVIPGLIDAHMHVESTMMTVNAFSSAVVHYGTTAVFMDPHEIANVLGMAGLRLFYEEGYNALIKVFTTIPSCVPASRQWDRAGAVFTEDNIIQALEWPDIAGLSEVMNYVEVVNGLPFYQRIINATMQRHLIPTGHLPTADIRQIMAYAATGINSDHQYSGREAALLKARLGMTIMIREATVSQDVHDVIRIITENHIDSRHILLVTDDVDPITLRNQGHLNHVVRRAIEEGVPPIQAIQMATINPATYFHVENEIGSITPGKLADLVLIPDLTRMEPTHVIVDGCEVSHDRHVLIPYTRKKYTSEVKHSIHVGKAWTAQDFTIPVTYSDTAHAKVRAITVRPHSTITTETIFSLPVKQSLITSDVQQDVLYLSILDRHHGSATSATAFVHGFGLTAGAVASTIAHDSHNLLVMGVSPEDMAFAVTELAAQQGGMIVVREQHVLARVPLPIAGLVADTDYLTLATQLDDLEDAWKSLGCPLSHPYMTFASLALPVIPELRLTTLGLVHVNQNRLIDIEIDPRNPMA